ncbi:hypothetical protein Ancab_029275 [Ancistrocladus abbreviatus]
MKLGKRIWCDAAHASTMITDSSRASINHLLQHHPKLARFMVGKASNRAGVHGSKLPVTEILEDKEEVEKEINKGKEEKEQKRKQVEDIVNSQLNHCQDPKQ